MSGFNAGPMPVESPGQLTAARIRQLMENAQKTIAERKAQLGFAEPSAVQTPNSLIADPERAERARRAAELQAKIQAKLNSSSVKNVLDKAIDSKAQDPNAKKPESDNKVVTIDAQGRTIDAATGEEIKMTRYTPTLKANIRAKKSQQFKEVLQSTEKKKASLDKGTIYYDPRISVKTAARPKRNLSFHEPGKFIKQGQQLRIKAQLERLQQSVAEAAKKTGIASAAKLATIQPKCQADETKIPDVEWWDNYILKDGYESYQSIDKVESLGQPVLNVVNDAWITRLIEHPITMKPPTHVNKPPELPLLLTKKEQKKLRRQNRLEAQKEVQEKVRLGLIPAPEPKVKLANLMRVLGTSAVQDPSKMEAFVRTQMESRKRAHEKANAERQLTQEQLRAKKIRKIKEDTSLRVHVAVYRVKDLSHPSHRFKVETNANQLTMTGIVALHNNCNVVVVEGGRKQQHKFKRLMLNRIKWNETHKRKAEAPLTEEAGGNKDSSELCQLIWEGTVRNRAFDKVQIKPCPTELYAREIFKKRDVEHYWDAAYATAVMEETSSKTS